MDSKKRRKSHKKRMRQIREDLYKISPEYKIEKRDVKIDKLIGKENDV